MRKPLDKRLTRELKSNLGKYIAIFLLLVATIAFGSGFLIVADSSYNIFQKNQIECKVEDGNFETYSILSNNITDKIQNLDIIVTKNSSIDYNYSEENVLRIFENRNEINLPSVFEGELPKEKNEISIDRLWAKNNNIKLGDNIKIKDYELKVIGLISIPDYNSLFKNNSDMVMDAKNFGVSLVSKNGLEELSHNNTLKNTYSYYYNNKNLTDKEKVEFENKITKILMEETQIINFTPARVNQSISFLENDLGTDIPCMKVLIYTMIAVMAFVFGVLTISTIEEEANIIGTLRASGYKKFEIVMHYIKLPVLITLMSAIIGNIIAYTIIIEPFKTLYYDFYSLPPLNLEWNMEAFLLTTIAPVLLMIIINYIMLTKKLSLSPLKFLRGDLKKGKNKKATKLPKFLSFKNRFRLRIIIQNKGSFIILFIGIFFASFLLMFGLGMNPLIEHYENTVSETVISDYKYILKVPIENEEGEKITIQSLKTYFKLAKRDIDVNFYGIIDNSKYYKGLNLVDKNEGVVISDSLANKLEIKIGDELTFNDKYTEKQYILKVKDIFHDMSGYAVYMPKAQLNEMLGNETEYFNGYLSNKKLDIDDKYVFKNISKEEIEGTVQQMMESFKELLVGVNAFSIGIYLVLMYVLTKIVIEKNAQNISLMKVFGYNEKEIKKLYLNATTNFIIFSLIVTIPLEIITFKLIMKYAFLKIEGYLEFYVPIYVYFLIIIIGIVSYFAINRIHIKKIRKIEARETLKNRE